MTEYCILDTFIVIEDNMNSLIATLTIPVVVLVFCGPAPAAARILTDATATDGTQVEPRGRPSYAILGDLKGQAECVTTPAEYITAFAARAARCVDPDLVGRIVQGRPGGTVNDTITLNVSYKLSNFWAGADTLEATMRIGFPQAIGDFTENHLQNYTSQQFAGIREFSNGQALMKAVGWPGAYVDITAVYSLHVFSRAAMKKVIRNNTNAAAYPYIANVDPLIPTWAALRHFMIHNFSPIGLNVSSAVVQVLSTVDIADLSGCPAECAYSLNAFPGPNATTPITTRPRNSDGSCPTVDNSVQMAPTSIDVESAFCSGYQGHSWTDKYVRLKP